MASWAALNLDRWWDGLSPQRQYILASLALVAVLLLGAYLIRLVDRWRRSTECETDTNRGKEQMSTFRELYEKGMLSQDEYDRIRNKLTTRMLGEAGRQTPPVEPAQPPTPLPGPPDKEKPPT